MYDAVGKPVLKDVLQGYNGSILAYGQTGSGKTHSLLNTGGRDGSKPTEAGLLPRVVAALFITISNDVKSVYGVEVAMFQIYNDQIDDLLVDGHSSGKGANLMVQKGGNVHGLTWQACKSPDELLKVPGLGMRPFITRPPAPGAGPPKPTPRNPLNPLNLLKSSRNSVETLETP